MRRKKNGRMRWGCGVGSRAVGSEVGEWGGEWGCGVGLWRVRWGMGFVMGGGGQLRYVGLEEGGTGVEVGSGVGKRDGGAGLGK